MDHAEPNSVLGHCGLSCGGCLAFAAGPIRRHAEELARLLGGNFSAHAERFAAWNPVFGHYGSFRELLDFLARGSCSGCREGGCLFGACPIRECVMGRGHAFCADCPDFPCAIQGLPEALERAWLASNRKIRELGPAAFWERIKDRPRYP